MTPSGVEWTAYFGAMTSWPEQTLSDARRAANLPQPHTYEAIDGLSSPLESRATTFQVATNMHLSGPAELWAAVRPQLDTRPPRNVTFVRGSELKPLPVFAFLGALQASLRAAAVHRDHPLPPAATQVAFVHNGIVRRLELAGMSRDPAYAHAFADTALIRNRSDVYQLRYRILNPRFETADFVLWAELPRMLRDDPEAPPLAPLGWELQLRSYLKLVFQRIN